MTVQLNDISAGVAVEPIDAPISILKGVHKKLGVLLRNFSKEDLKRMFVHPEHLGQSDRDQTV